MGFAVSTLLAGGLAEQGRYAIAFTGDGSFLMNPQVLVYYGPDPLGGMSAYGRWNVGNWCAEVQKVGSGVIITIVRGPANGYCRACSGHYSSRPGSLGSLEKSAILFP